MIQDIRLQKFRSYKDDSFELSPSVNIIVGPNASGKTNLLEAILVLARGNSYRAADNELIEFEEDWGRLDANVSGIKRTVKIERVPKPSKTYELDGRVYKRLTHAVKLPTVLFEPNHLLLLTGSPEKRRLYLDDLLDQTNVAFGPTLRAYRRSLSQRNSLLKKGSIIDKNQLFPWNVRLSELAGTIVRSRTELVELINKNVSELYKDLSKTKTNIALVYKSQAKPENYETQMLHQLDSRLSDDLRRGFTSFGPHREDFEVLIDGHLAENSASRGETRTLVLALKVIEMQIIENIGGNTPLLLLDDVFSELDGTRRRALTTFLQPYQSFITTTDADVVVKHFTETAKIIPLAKPLL